MLTLAVAVELLYLAEWKMWHVHCIDVSVYLLNVMIHMDGLRLAILYIVGRQKITGI